MISNKEINEMIEDRVEYSLTSKLLPFVKWGIAITVTIFCTLGASFVGIAYWRGKTDTKIEAQNIIITDFIAEQRVFNKKITDLNQTLKDGFNQDKMTTNEKLNSLLANDFVIKNYLKKIDPDVELPTVTFRGEIKSSNDKQ
jgi:hypothetical protein